MPVSLVTATQMREIEERAAQMGAPSPVLMENAGAAVARSVLRIMEQAGSMSRRALVLVGPGNNGGDGLVVARHLHDAEVATTIYVWKRDLQHPDANLALVQTRHIALQSSTDDPQQRFLAAALESLNDGDIVVDALLGTGRARPIEGELAAILDLVNESRTPAKFKIVALDLPTGINSDTGEADAHMLKADYTITLGFPKVGLYLFPGAALTGQIEIVGIGIPQPEGEDTGLYLITPDEVRKRLPERPFHSNKGTFGKALVVAGSLNYTGAAYLSASAAGRAGAGLVTLALARAIYPILAARISEATFLPLDDEDGALSDAALENLQKQMQQYTVTLLGPGLGRHAATQRMVLGAVRSAVAPLVIDADGLNAVSEALKEKNHSEIFPADTRAVLTPHPGELGRILGSDAEAVEADRLEAIHAAVERTGQVVVLKGAHTLIAAPGTPVWMNPTGNAAMATAGTGDVLAGTICGLLAQGLEPLDAAICGVYIHAAAGLLAREEYGDAGMLAGDLLPLVPKAMKQLRQP